MLEFDVFSVPVTLSSGPLPNFFKMVLFKEVMGLQVKIPKLLFLQNDQAQLLEIFNVDLPCRPESRSFKQWPQDLI